MVGEDCSKADVLNEALNQARIEETGLNIPAILEVAMVDGKWASVSEYVKGKTCPMLGKFKVKMNRKISMSDQDATICCNPYPAWRAYPSTTRSATATSTPPTSPSPRTARPTS